MPKNIILLSDGTGNSSAKVFRTNVWRLSQILDLSDPARQVAYYDDGVGTSSFKLFAILGGVFGFGLKRNVIDIYSFCCRNYQPGDRIYCFGFSRGAFTIRIVAGMIARVGLVNYNGSEANLARDAEIAYRAYRKVRNFRSGANILIRPLRALRDWVSHAIFRKPTFQQLDLIEVEKINFLGVWDTVDAYGGPIEEITRAIDYWYWPLSMPDQFMSHKIVRACHALALEEERDAFQPGDLGPSLCAGRRQALSRRSRLETGASRPQHALGRDRSRAHQSAVVCRGTFRCRRRLFAGRPLAYCTLAWIMERAAVYGLTYLTDTAKAALKSFVNPYDKLNDSRHGLAGYYRYRPRKLADVYSQPPYKLSLVEDARHICQSVEKPAGPRA